MKPTLRLALLAPIFCTFSAPLAHAADGTWTSTATSGNWINTDTSPWLGGVVAEGATSTASFTSDITALTTVTLTAPRTIGNITFSDNGAAGNAWTIARTSTNTLTLGDNVGAGTTSPIINTITNATITSVIAGNDGITKTGAGTLTLSANNSAFRGALIINQGTVELKQTSGNFTSFGGNGTNALVLNGGTIKQTFNQGGATNGTVFASTTLNAGSSTIFVDSGAGTNTTSMHTGTVTRNVGGTLSFIIAGTTISNAQPNTKAVNTNGILGYATFTSPTLTNTWAVGSADGTANPIVTGLATASYSTTAASTTTANVDVTTSTLGSSAANSLRFNGASAKTLTLNGATTITSGGILVSSTVGNNASVITGGTSLAGAAGQDLIVHQNNTASTLTIQSNIVNNGGATGLTKSGAGSLVLSGTNTYSGNTYVNAGALNLADAASLKFLIGDSGVNNAITGIGTLILDGDFVIDLASAAAVGSWQLVDNTSLTETYNSSTFSVAGWTDNGNTWTTMFDGATYTFSEVTGALTAVPEPGAALLGGLGLLVLLRRRRA